MAQPNPTEPVTLHVSNQPTPQQHTNATLLIVDDDHATLSGLELFFSSQFDTISCADSNTALAIARQGQVDLILLDINMPGMDGLALCETLQAGEITRHIPVIVFTGKISDDTEFKSLSAGAVDFLAKPVDLQTLRLKVENHMKLARHRRDLAEISYTDTLTGVADRRYMDTILKRECLAAARAELPLSIALIDIDDFEAYVDAFGSHQGDQCFTEIAKLFKDCLKRENDLLGRYGEQDFLLILPHTDRAGAELTVNTLLDALRQENVPHPTSSCTDRVSVSVGIASYSPQLLSDDEVNATTLLEEADQQLYWAKQQGKNRIAF